jgi:hypothetical protein
MALLSLAIWTPIVFGVVLLAMGRDEHVKAVRALALMGAVLSLLLTLPLYEQFQYNTSAMQFVEKAALIPHLLADTPSVYTDDAHSRLRSCNIDMKLSVCNKRCKTTSHTIVILSIDRCYTG